ncbi:nickel pincer cofactor biosynthesis protein LarC [Geobacter grbiciae]|uniref:nickel pincer cofactor biosynthesis protein LarC n=1 Tax=Geobacter grbiciae TaxID=155042 RepID=UPI001C03900A|nr:nickel pincer cofactor biosynthesis protein LarC [Geobacter grbiciae]MBT1073672.1 nickel pincer cofactor biosynthesis protein LarC [Geobacter grbiciae]
MKILYCDCFAGIAGDMTVAALLDLGVPFEVVEGAVKQLPLPHSSYSLAVERTSRKGIAAARFVVHVEEHQPHRHYADIAAMIEESTLAEGVKEKAQRIFFRLAEAEAKVHGVEIGRVHFHEVGAVDSIVDIVGAAAALEWLGIDAIHAAPLPLGSGFVETAHGRLPVPAPATAELLRGLPIHGEAGSGERVTPTGAAILAALATGFGRAPAMTVTGVGCGAGTKDFEDIPNVLRLFVGEAEGGLLRDEVCIIETHIDDMNPEILGHVLERLMEAGALDAAFSPLQMKKNRPAVKLTVIARPGQRDELAALVLRETSAIGVRFYPAGRLKLAREKEERPTSLGPVTVKVIRDGGRVVRVTPEYDACRRIAAEREMSLLEVYRIVEREAGES